MDRAIIVASFGATSPSLRSRAIEPFEKEVAEAFPDHAVLRAFTSPLVIERIEKKEGIAIDSLSEALERAIDSSVKDVSIIPTLPIEGIQFDSISRISKEYEERFDAMRVCPPLLEVRDTAERFLERIPEVFPEAFQEKTALVMLGHGNSSVTDGHLCRLQVLSSLKGMNVFFTTVTGTPSPQDMASMLSAKGIEKVNLAPLMFEAGFHARRDMCSDKGSVKTILEGAGFETECIMKGLGEIPIFREMFIDSLRRTLSG